MIWNLVVWSITVIIVINGLVLSNYRDMAYLGKERFIQWKK